MSGKKVTQIDYIPKIGVNNEFIKLYDRYNHNMENILTINNILMLIETRKGTNKEFPNFGLAQEFRKLSFINVLKIDEVLNEIKMLLTEQSGHEDIEMSYEIINPESPQPDIRVIIKVSNIQGNFEVTVANKMNNSKAIATKYAY